MAGKGIPPGRGGGGGGGGGAAPPGPGGRGGGGGGAVIEVEDEEECTVGKVMATAPNCKDEMREKHVNESNKTIDS